MMTPTSSASGHSHKSKIRGRLLSNSQRGVTLIEVLVTLLVLSIGLVGIALLNLNSLKFAHSSYYTSAASSAALDLEERLWVALGSRAEGCLDLADVNGVINDINTLWSDPDASEVGIPTLDVELRTPLFRPTFTEVPITLSWSDARFVDGESEFAFSARAVCFVPPIESEEEE